MRLVEVPEIPVRQLIGWTIAATLTVAGFWLLVRFHNVVVLLVAAIILSTVVRPGMLWLEKRGLSRSVGLLAIFLLVIVLLAALVWYTVPLLAAQGSAIGTSLREGYTLLLERLRSESNMLVRRLLSVVPETLPTLGGAAGPADPVAPVEGEADMAVSAAIQQVGGMVRALFNIAVIGLLTFFWTLEGERIKGAALLLVPLNRRSAARARVRDIEAQMNRYLYGQGLLCLIIGALAFVAYAALGLPNALLLGIFAGLMEAVPILGPVLGAVPAVMIALSISPTTALWVVAVVTLIQIAENNLLVPRIMRRAIGMHPIISILALLLFSALFGILGALIALPVTAVVANLVQDYMLQREAFESQKPGRDRLSVMRYETNQLVQDVRSQVRQKEATASALADILEDEVEAIALDLESYLALQERAEQ